MSAVVLVAALAGACAGPAGGPAERRDVDLARDADTTEARVPRNATLEGLLRQHDLPADVTTALVGAVRGVFNPRELRADRSYRIVRTLDGLFREFQYQIDADRFLRVVARGASAGDPRFDVAIVPYPKEIEIDAARAEITRERPSLVAAFDGLGENVQLALLLAEVFGGEIDFNSDLQRGDRIEVLFERVRRQGERAGYGDVQAAILQNAGRRIAGIRFVGPDGKPGWYDEDGRSLKRQFLRSPLRFEPRITSRFSLRRLHPVHGDYRAHLGVDYSAPYGAPVVAVAAGTVISAGWSGEAGRTVRLRHAGGYETMYLHLSAFAPGIRAGARVAQGELIGRVGSSGTSTAPHLDYRIRRNGAYVNPLVEISRMPKGDPIDASLREAFERQRDRVLAELGARLDDAPAAATRPGSRPD